MNCFTLRDRGFSAWSSDSGDRTFDVPHSSIQLVRISAPYKESSFRLPLPCGYVVEDKRLVPAIGDGDDEYRSRPDALNGSMESHAVGGTAGHHDNARLGDMVASAILLKIVANTHTIG